VSDVPPLTERALREPLRIELARRTRRIQSDGVASAVLLPLYEDQGETWIWLLRRAADMRKHAGQVALPGGKRDPGDRDAVDTATREAFEEIGLQRASIDILGPLYDMHTHTGFVITPIVGWIAPGFIATPSAAEVARVFPVPLRLFTGKATGVFPRVGHTHDGELIWGITLMIVRSFFDVLRQLPPALPEA
jgi:8-oxo-dGTP pyrophosphatase MutT (NUDIX family)